eukprot:1160066-Pelagomonas_calceolata.AAC.8
MHVCYQKHHLDARTHARRTQGNEAALQTLKLQEEIELMRVQLDAARKEVEAQQKRCAAIEVRGVPLPICVLLVFFTFFHKQPLPMHRGKGPLDDSTNRLAIGVQEEEWSTIGVSEEDDSDRISLL